MKKTHFQDSTAFANSGEPLVLQALQNCMCFGPQEAPLVCVGFSLFRERFPERPFQRLRQKNKFPFGSSALQGIFVRRCPVIVCTSSIEYFRVLFTLPENGTQPWSICTYMYRSEKLSVSHRQLAVRIFRECKSRGSLFYASHFRAIFHCFGIHLYTRNFTMFHVSNLMHAV